MSTLAEVIVSEVALLFDPLRRAVTDPEMRRRLLAQMPSAAPSAGDFDRLIERIAPIARAVESLVELARADSQPPLDRVLTETSRLITAIHELANTPLPGITLDPRFAQELIEVLLGLWMERRHPLLIRTLDLMTLGEPGAELAAEPGQAAPRSWSRLRFDRVGRLLQRPAETLREEYLPRPLMTAADARVTADKLFPRLARLLQELNISAVYGLNPHTAPDFGPFGNQMGAGMLTIFFWKDGAASIGVTLGLSAADMGNLGLVVVPFGAATETYRAGRWEFEFTLAGAGPGFAIGPSGFVVDVGTARAEAQATARKLPASTGAGGPAFLFGDARGARLELERADVTARFSASTEGADGGFLFDFGRIALIIPAGEADSFLRPALPRDGLRATFDLSVGWSRRGGIYFRGSGGLEVSIPTRLTLPGIEIRQASLALRAADNKLLLTAGVSATLRVGPLSATVERVGMSGALDFPPGKDGNLGFANLQVGFRPPSGIGLTVEAGPVTGGGFLSFDPDAGRYTGVLQLQIYTVSLKAIGLLDTKLPGGAPGFSLLLIISAEFAPIQLGFGFTLNGVGGLAGIHRTVVTEALQAGIRNHSFDNILFPQDPVRNASQLVSDLRTVFPPATGRFVFGPMAKIGWGTPSLLEAEIGILIELPDPVRLVILGQLTVLLPKREAAIIELHIDVLGIIDFGRQCLSIDASLHDSRLAIFSIYGDMALRLSWGEQPNFALSLGGLNPHFPPPPNFPTLRRLTIALGDGENPRITCQAYVALTSNTVQFGARAEVYASAGPFSINGWIGFDVLVIFSPFSFRADFGAGVTLSAGGSVLASVRLEATLEGPTPFHIWGRASLSILFFDISVPFDATFGETQRVELPAVNPWPQLQQAMQDARNWSAPLPPETFQVVSLTAPSPGATHPPTLVDPAGGLTLRQKVLPLNETLGKFGETRIDGPRRYSIDGARVGARPASRVTGVKDFFARAQFVDMSAEQKLSIPSFELMDAGVSLESAAVEHGEAMGSELSYKTIIIDSPQDTRPAPTYSLPLAHQLSLLRVGAAAVAPLNDTGFKTFQVRAASRTALNDESFVITSTSDLSVRADITPPLSKGAAFQALEEYLAASPHERGSLQIVSLQEVEGA